MSAPLTTLDLFTIGIGPSSSHTVGPMRAAGLFREELAALPDVAAVHGVLHGSLAATGRGHGTDLALLSGLAGEQPEETCRDRMNEHWNAARDAGGFSLADGRMVAFDPGRDVERRLGRLPLHANALTLTAADARGEPVLERTYYSVGGGFVLDGNGAPIPPSERHLPPSPFASAEELLSICQSEGLSIAEVMERNDVALLGERRLHAGIDRVWEAMQRCIATGLRSVERTLPGGLGVPRRAPGLFAELSVLPEGESATHTTEWVSLFALAVNEENASGGTVVTAPTNGAAGIIPAVLHYYLRFVPRADVEGIHRFLLTAAAIGLLFKANASISGAEVGCQGEVGSACSMAAAGLCAVLGGTPRQIENSAEIALEHHLGLTCDPVGGLVQIPCIERNAVAANTAIVAARLAMRGSGAHKVPLDTAIRTMRDTGRDMRDEYKETSLGGLAVNVVEC
jgi:L-serine dehydratase